MINSIHLRFLKHCWQCPILVTLQGKTKSRSSRSEVFCKRDVVRNFSKFTGGHLCQRLILNPFVKIESLTQVFLCEFCEQLSKNTIFYRTPQVAASVKTCNFTKIRLCHMWVFFCRLSKNFKNGFLMRCKNFLKITGEKKIC